jgi:hypothetical protein
MGNPDDLHYEGSCGCSLDICGECGKCLTCCECHECPDCDEDNNRWPTDSDEWCEECDRCTNHCVCEMDVVEEDDVHTKCRQCGRVVKNSAICGDKKHENICTKCAGCAGIPCSKCPLDQKEAESKTGDETGVTVYFKSDNNKPPSKEED